MTWLPPKNTAEADESADELTLLPADEPVLLPPPLLLPADELMLLAPWRGATQRTPPPGA